MKKSHALYYLILAIILILIIEIGIFIIAIQRVGIWPILGWVSVAAGVGSYFLYHHYFKMEGFREELKIALRADEKKGTEMLFKKLILPFIGGWLFITPGAFTDLLAVICFTPFVSRKISQWVTLRPRRETEESQATTRLPLRRPAWPVRPSSRSSKRRKNKRGK